MINFNAIKQQLDQQIEQKPAEQPIINKIAEKTKPIFERSYPPFSEVDTVMFDNNGKKVSVHGKADFFKNNEIIHIRKKSLPAPQSNQNLSMFPIAKTTSGKVVLQQQSIRGCTEGCVEMLKADNGKKIDFSRMRNCNLGNEESMTSSLKKSGLIPIVSHVNFEHLNEALEKHGSAIISVYDPDISSHAVILDKIDYKAKTAYIRDPFHGWAIVVKLDAFRERLGNSTSRLIQVQTKK